MAITDAKRPLLALGFTDLEADVYVHLLHNPGSTGYKIAQGIGRLQANVYQAIDSLAIKGAVIVEQGKSRVCRAVHPEEVLALARAKFEQSEREALEALREPEVETADDRLYRLTSTEQVYARAEQMLKSGKKVALVDLFPPALARLKPAIQEAASRYRLFVKSYEETEIPGADVWMNPGGDKILDKYPGVVIVILVDGLELLMAWLSEDGKSVRQALWTGSPTLVHLFHTSFLGEMELVALQTALVGIRDIAQLKELLQSLEPTHYPKVTFPLNELFPRFHRWYTGTPGFERLVNGPLEDAANVDSTE